MVFFLNIILKFGKNRYLNYAIKTFKLIIAYNYLTLKYKR